MATVMLEGGADVRYIIQAMLGHVSLATTPIYTHVTITKLREVHERTHPARLFRLAAPAPRHADSAAPPHCLANPDGGAETPSYGPADPLDVDHDATAGII